MVCYHFDHTQGRSVKGVNFLSLFYQAPGINLPIAAQLIEKTEPGTDQKTGKPKFKSKLTKNQYLQDMLKVAQNQVDYKYLLADSWYASAENMQSVLNLKHDFIFALESSRTVALSEKERKNGIFSSLDSVVFPANQVLKVYLRSLKEALFVVKQVECKQRWQSGFFISGNK